MDIAMAGTDPVDEFDPELVGRVGFADELVLVDAEQRVEQADLRNRRLADADGADRLALDQLDLEAGKGAHDARDRGGRHQPAVPPPTMTMRRTGSPIMPPLPRRRRRSRRRRDAGTRPAAAGARRR